MRNIMEKVFGHWGKIIDEAAHVVADNVVGGAKYVVQSPHEIVKAGNLRVRQDRIHGLVQAALYGKPVSGWGNCRLVCSHRE